jgi:hypothetical protein
MLRTPDVIDELFQPVTEAGGSIEHVKKDTQLTECTLPASLLFPLPPARPVSP